MSGLLNLGPKLGLQNWVTVFVTVNTPFIAGNVPVLEYVYNTIR
jgi:hypothetical protein